MFLKIILTLLASCVFSALTIWLIDEYKKLHFAHSIKMISNRYQDIRSLNRQYVFYHLRSIPSRTYFAETKEEFDSFDFDKHLLSLMNRETAYFDALLCAAEHNKSTLQSYRDALAMCSPAIDRKTAKTNGIEYHQAIRKEQQLISNIAANPITEFTLQYTLKYYCPVKKANLEAIKGYSMEDIHQLRRKVKKSQPTQIVFTEMPRSPNMWRLAKIQCSYDAAE